MLVGGPVGHGGQAPVVGQAGRLGAVAGHRSSTGAVGSSAKRPTTVSVLPTSMASSMVSPFRSVPAAGSRGRGRGRAPGPSGSSAPTDSRSAPAAGQRRARSPGHPAGHLDQGGDPGARTHGPTHSATCSGPMLSSMTTVAPAATASATWSSRSHSTSTMRPGHEVPGPGHRLGDGEPAQVVVLDQDGLGQAAPVVVPAAGPDRRLLQGPQPRRGLAGVEHPGGRVGRLHRVDVAPGQGGHAGQVAEEVERGPLGGEDRAQRTR